MNTNTLLNAVENSCFASLEYISDILEPKTEYTAKAINSLINRCYQRFGDYYNHQRKMFEYTDAKSHYQWTNLTCFRLYAQLSAIERKRTKHFTI